MFAWGAPKFLSAFAREGSLAAAARALGVEHATVARPSRRAPLIALWRLARVVDSARKSEDRDRKTTLRNVMKELGLQLLHGDFLARSVRGIPCAPPQAV